MRKVKKEKITVYFNDRLQIYLDALESYRKWRSNNAYHICSLITEGFAYLDHIENEISGVLISINRIEKLNGKDYTLETRVKFYHQSDRIMMAVSYPYYRIYSKKFIEMYSINKGGRFIFPPHNLTKIIYKDNQCIVLKNLHELKRLCEIKRKTIIFLNDISNTLKPHLKNSEAIYNANNIRLRRKEYCERLCEAVKNLSSCVDEAELNINDSMLHFNMTTEQRYFSLKCSWRIDGVRPGPGVMGAKGVRWSRIVGISPKFAIGKSRRMLKALPHSLTIKAIKQSRHGRHVKELLGWRNEINKNLLARKKTLKCLLKSWRISQKLYHLMADDKYYIHQDVLRTIYVNNKEGSI